ncbi:MAG TPA: SBBP repeat-containing protein, partial [Chthoniobacterales bacterium]|nr:SBBP repeat-containing protein [Chthoniobacterales bacterium]
MGQGISTEGCMGFGWSRKRFLLFVFAIASFVAIWSFAGPQPTQITTSTSTPAVVSSTYFGGSGDVFSGYDITWATATDSNGNVYIAGDSNAPDFPVTTSAFQRTYAGGGQDGFVAKFDRYGNLLWSTFLGGSGWDGVYSLAVDSNGNAVVTGVTASSDFPITANAVQKTIAANTDAAFVTVISADGRQVLYSTFLGGTIGTSTGPLPVNIGHILPTDGPFTIGDGVALENDGTIYLAGGTNTIDMPVTPVGLAAQPVMAGEENGFVARIDPTKSGSAGLIYCTYLGGALQDFAAAVAVDPSGDAFVTGEAQSLNFPTTLGAYQHTHTPGTAGFVTELNPTGTAMIYSTLVSGSNGSSAAGGTNYNAPSAIVIDSVGHAFIAGETNASDYPTTTGVVQPNFAGQDDGFVTELSADGSSLVFSTYLGGSDYDGLFAIKIDNGGNIFVGGYSASRDLILKNAFQTAFGNYYEGWAAALSPGGTSLLFSSYLGGDNQNSIYGLALWNDQLYLGGRTASTSFPVTSGAAQETYGGGVWDNFLTIVDLNPTPVQLLRAVSRKTHGTAGTFDVDLPLSGTPGIECRSGGADGDYTIVSTFANAMTNVADVE